MYVALRLSLLVLLLTPTSMAQTPLRMVPFHRVHMEDALWRPRIKTLVRETLPHAFANTRVAQERLRLCAEFLENGGGPKPEPHRFNTSDLYKVMEGAALMIQSEPHAEIEAQMDRIIDVIARAQKKDGYLYVPHITGSIRENEMGPRPYSFLAHSHELYNVGHLYEAAVAYAQATGKTKLLDVAIKNARHVQRAIFEGDPDYNDGRPVMQAPGHQEIELGLVKLFHQTGETLFLEMAKRFLDIRGVTFTPHGEGVNSPTYAQQHLPVNAQREAVGHAVRAAYMYAAMAEVEGLLGTHDFDEALDAIWHDVVDRKMHVTGGLGAVHGIEGFGPPYELPNEDTYLETCAAVANVFWNVRMFLKHENAKYLDVAEIALLNNALAGCGLDGKSFFYPNPLEASYGHRPRSAWFGTACCPSNIARLIPQVSGYQYATRGNDLFACLYGASRATIELDGQAVTIHQETTYPWSGLVRFRLEVERPVEATFRLRIPTWVGTQLVPGELYRFTRPSPAWSLTINDEPIRPTIEHGFAVIRRTWNTGDRLTLDLPMPVKTNVCNAKVAANRDRVAFSRGPLVYCAEGIDNDGAVQRFFVDADHAAEDARVSKIDEGLLAGMVGIDVNAFSIDLERRVGERPLHLVPYFAWSNRDRGSMMTWFGTLLEQARPDTLDPRHWKFAGATASHTFANDLVDAVRMPHTPRSSRDGSIPRWTSWPQRGRDQWVEIDLGEERSVRSVGVYFYDDGGGVQVPGSWNLAVLDEGETWRQVAIYNTDSYSTLKDAFNTVHPASSLTTRRLRIELRPQHDGTCVGLLAVDVETH